MAAFAKATFSHASYATFRPSYPQSLYDTVLGFRHGRHALVIDLGCGTGTVTRSLSPYFDRCIGIDPSPGMVRQAETHAGTSSNVCYQSGNAETALDSFDAGSVDCVVAGQAAHWFDFSKLWPSLERAVRPGGMVAFWGYKDHVFVDYPAASAIMQHYAYADDRDMLGPYWSQPGRSYVENKLRSIQPPSNWQDTGRIEYEPGSNGPRSGQGTLFMERQMTVDQCKGYIRTWSAYHGWLEAHPRKTPDADVVDELFEKMAETDPVFANPDATLAVEWGSGLVMARRKS